MNSVLPNKKKFQRFGVVYRDPIPRFHVGARQRSLLTDNDLSVVEDSVVLTPGDIDPDQGVESNYMFVEYVDASDNRFALRKPGDAEEYVIFIQGGSGAEYILIEAGVNQTPGTDPVAVESFGFQFSSDGYFRLKNVDTGLWHAITVDAGVLVIAAGIISAAASFTYNPGLNFRITGNKFDFKDIVTGDWYRPTITGLVNPQIQLTLQ